VTEVVSTPRGTWGVRTFGSAKGKSVVLLHGFMGSSVDWQMLAESCGEQFRFVALDLPGHGSTDLVEGSSFDMSATVAGVRELIGKTGHDTFHLLGYSMGARVALALALTSPEAVISLVLESGSPGLAGENQRAERRVHDERLAQRLESESLEAFVADWYHQPVFANVTSDRKLIDALRKRCMSNDARMLARSLREIGTGAQPSYWDRLEELTMPTLLIAGGSDHKFLTIANRMTTACPAAEARIVPESGHIVHLEKPLEFAKIVASFWRRIGS